MKAASSMVESGCSPALPSSQLTASYSLGPRIGLRGQRHSGVCGGGSEELRSSLPLPPLRGFLVSPHNLDAQVPAHIW